MNDREDEATRRLEDLEARIEKARKDLEQHDVITGELRREWDDMLRRHAELRRRLQSGEAKKSEAAATLNEDIDVLRHAFFRWASQVEERFKGPPDVQ
ncbi:MAG TPA: hypothetical protein VF226_19755 [Hyphomicrobiaceae bacterium]|jgi:predicted  nucleic acid-binding Zn-ribbon protein